MLDWGFTPVLFPTLPKQLVVILGMHRSGTSLITKSIELFGFSLGENLMEASEDNPTGFWEDQDLVALNDQILASNQTTWDSPLDTIERDFSEHFHERAKSLLQSKLDFTDRLVLKDPRLCLLLPFWSEQFRALELDVHFIALYRNPLEVAASLSARDDMSIEQGLLLDYVYNSCVLRHSGYPVCLVNYRQFLAEPLRELGRIADHLGLVLPEEEAMAFVDSFVDQNLCHHEYIHQDLIAHEGSFPEVVDLSQLMLRLSAGERVSFDPPVIHPDRLNRLQELQSRRDFDTRVDLRIRLDALDAEVRLSQAEVRNLGNQLRERESHIEILKEEARLSQAEVRNLGNQLRDREGHIDILKEEARLSRAEVRNLGNQLREREDHIEIFKEEERLFRAEVRNLGNQLREREGHIEILKEDERLSRAEVRNLGNQLRERESHIDILKEEARLSRAEVRNLGNQLQERESHIDILKEEARLSQAEVRNLGNQLRERESHIEILKENVEGLNRDVSRANDALEQGQRAMEDLDRIHRDVLGSVSYRLGRLITYPIRKPVTLWVLPRLKDDGGARALVNFLRTCIARPLATLKLLSFQRVRNFFLLLTRQSQLAEQVAGNYIDAMTHKSYGFDSGPMVSTVDLQALNLSFVRPEQPRVSVVIPVYNQIGYTALCLESIYRNLPKVTMELVIADDCSTDETETVLSGISGIEVIRHPENLGFLRSCNRAVDFCRGEYVFLLNNDTLVTPGWLDTLVETLDRYPDTGLVGSKLIYPDGTLQEAGGIIWRDASGWNYGRNGDPDAPEFNYLREVDYVSGAAVLFRRQLFLDLGKFDEDLAPAYCEDTDLAFRIRQAGRKVFYQPASVVVHYEGKSHGTDENSGIKSNQRINQKKLREKWSEQLDLEHFENGERVLVARERAADKTTVLVVDHYVPHFDKDAGSRSTYLYLKLLVDAGCNVKFIGDNFFRHEPYTTVLQELGIEVLYGPYYQKHWRDWISQCPGYIDVVYLMRPHVAERYIDYVNSLEPRPKTIYFGHDLHYLRLERQLEVKPDAELEPEIERWRKLEYELFEKFDLIYYPSEVEVSEIKTNNPELPVKAIPVYAFDHFNDETPDFGARQGLIFVGGFNHPPNADGLFWFIKEVFPEVLEEVPNMTLHVVGSNMPAEIKQLESENIRMEGYVSDDRLAELYGRVRLSVVPLRFGAGVKGKVLEALDRGVPVVTTATGAEGIPDDEACLEIAEDARAMAKDIVELHGNESELNRRSRLGRNLVRKSFSHEAVLEVIADDFKIGEPVEE